MSHIIGIATPHRADPDCSEQLQLLANYGCDPIFHPRKMSAKNFRTHVIFNASPGDTLVACKLEYFATSPSDLYSLTNQALDLGLHLRTIDGNLDTTNAASLAVLTAFLGATKFFHQQKTLAALAAAAARGQSLGRKRRFSEDDWPRIRNKLLNHPLSRVAKDEQVTRQTIYKFVELMTGSHSIKDI